MAESERALVSQKDETSAVVARTIPPEIVKRAEDMVERLGRGELFHHAQRDSGLLAGQMTLIMDNAPELWKRIETACTVFKKLSKHAVLQKAVGQVMDGHKREVVDKDGCVHEIKEDVSVGDMVKLLGGLDKDFAKQPDSGQTGSGAQMVVMNVNLGADIMASIRAGNADVVSGAHTAAKDATERRKAGNVVDAEVLEEKK